MPALIIRFALLCRTVAAMLIAGVLRRQDDAEVEMKIAARPLREQALITGLVLIALFISALLAAQFGLWGLLIYAGLIVYLAR
ncbi:MAG: hypothetical protein AAGC92_03020 [Pseudomonadota bacterium]